VCVCVCVCACVCVRVRVRVRDFGHLCGTRTKLSAKERRHVLDCKKVTESRSTAVLGVCCDRCDFVSLP